MMTWFASLKAKLIGAGIILCAVLLFIWRTRARAYRAGRQDTVAQTWEKTIETVTTATAIRDRVGAAGRTELDRMRDKWTRHPE